MDKATLAARATHASGIRFYKSYVKNIKLEEVRKPDHESEWIDERDYSFRYKGTRYRVNQYIKPNENGEKRYSGAHTYELMKEVDGRYVVCV